MQRWAFGLECPSFKTIDKINKVKYVSSLFWLCSHSRSIPSSNLLQLSSVTAALPPRAYILNRSVFPSANMKTPPTQTIWCSLNGSRSCGQKKQAESGHKWYKTSSKALVLDWKAVLLHQLVQWKLLFTIPVQVRQKLNDRSRESVTEKKKRRHVG